MTQHPQKLSIWDTLTLPSICIVSINLLNRRLVLAKTNFEFPKKLFLRHFKFANNYFLVILWLLWYCIYCSTQSIVSYKFDISQLTRRNKSIVDP